MRRAWLVEANLREATLTGAQLHYASLTGANLTGADLQLAYLPGARLRGADLSGASFGAKNLTQEQLDSACANPDKPVRHLREGIKQPPPCPD